MNAPVAIPRFEGVATTAERYWTSFELRKTGHIPALGRRACGRKSVTGVAYMMKAKRLS